MSIRDAIVNSTESVLSIYLAPDLAARLSEEIMAQAMPEIQEALGSCIGVDLSKPAKSAAGKSAGKAAKSTKSTKARKEKESVENKDGDGDDDDIDVPMNASKGDDGREMMAV